MKFQKALVAFAISFAPTFGARADSSNSKVIPLGEDLSITSYTLKAKTCTIGFQFAACGLTDKISLGTSPWLLEGYNAYNLAARAVVGTPTESERRAIQLAYFKTHDNVMGNYEMELFWLYFVQTYFVTPEYTLHLNVQSMYYLDDKWPFSMRRPWADRHPLQFNLGALNEIHLNGGFYINAEFSVLGMTQSNPDFLLGLSFEYRTASWLFHGGFCQTGTALAYVSPKHRFDYQALLLDQTDGFNGPINGYDAKFDYAIHPELAVQYYF